MQTHPLDYAGLGAAEAVKQLILSFRNLSKITIASYSHLPMIQDRIEPSYAEKEVVAEALRLRKSLHFPFWDCVMLTITKSEDPMDLLLDTASTHASLRESDIAINRKSIEQGALEQHICQNTQKSIETCIISEIVMTDGSIRHLPMIDFHCPPTTAGRIAATAVCKRIFPNGSLLLKSGESFHAYGLELMATSDFFSFLGRALLYSPIIDRAYIAHQLIERRCALRISGVSKPVPTTLEIL